MERDGAVACTTRDIIFVGCYDVFFLWMMMKMELMDQRVRRMGERWLM